MDLRIWMKLGIYGFFGFSTQLNWGHVEIRFEFFDFIFKANKNILLQEKRLETTHSEF
jgi:hypothetical protein